MNGTECFTYIVFLEQQQSCLLQQNHCELNNLSLGTNPKCQHNK